MSCARTIAKRSISVRWSAVSPRVQRRAAIVAAWLAPGSMARAIRPAARVSSQRERCERLRSENRLRSRSAVDSESAARARRARTRSSMARASIEPIASGPATDHSPKADGRSVATWNRVPPASPDVNGAPDSASPNARSCRAESTSVRASSSNPASMPAAPRASLRTCSSAGGTNAVPMRVGARFVDLRLRQQQPLGRADRPRVDSGLREERLELLRRHAPAPRVTRDANSVAARRRSTWSSVASSRRASSHAGSAPSSRVRARSCCL